jgi:DNA-binding LacI/PurR family transcriptional regulator
VDALIILAQDTAAIGPAVQAAADAGIPVIAYDRLIEDARAFYITFDNVEVGRMQARAVLEAAPEGNYVMIKGSPTDPNADFLRGGQQEVLQEGDRLRRDHHRGRGLHGPVAPCERAAEHGADPDRAEQRGSTRWSPRTTAPRAASWRR